MDAYVIVLRIVHIVAGAFWVGASVTFAFFLEPTAAAVGPAAGPFMGHLTTQKKFPVVIGIVSMLNLVAGVLLYWRMSSGFDTEWISTGPGLGFTVGGAAAIVSWLIGFTVLRPGVGKLGPLAAAQARGDAGAQDQMQRLQQRLKSAGLINVSLLLFAVTAMAAARYL